MDRAIDLSYTLDSSHSDRISHSLMYASAFFGSRFNKGDDSDTSLLKIDVTLLKNYAEAAALDRVTDLVKTIEGKLESFEFGECTYPSQLENYRVQYQELNNRFIIAIKETNKLKRTLAEKEDYIRELRESYKAKTSQDSDEFVLKSYDKPDFIKSDNTASQHISGEDWDTFKKLGGNKKDWDNIKATFYYDPTVNDMPNFLDIKSVTYGKGSSSQQGVFVKQNYRELEELDTIPPYKIIGRYKGEIHFSIPKDVESIDYFAELPFILSNGTTFMVHVDGKDHYSGKLNHRWELYPTREDYDPEEPFISRVKPDYQPAYANVVLNEQSEYVTMRHISPGEELVWDYGKGYWKAQKILPYWDITVLNATFLTSEPYIFNHFLDRISISDVSNFSDKIGDIFKAASLDVGPESTSTLDPETIAKEFDQERDKCNALKKKIPDAIYWPPEYKTAFTKTEGDLYEFYHIWKRTVIHAVEKLGDRFMFAVTTKSEENLRTIRDVWNYSNEIIDSIFKLVSRKGSDIKKKDEREIFEKYLRERKALARLYVVNICIKFRELLSLLTEKSTGKIPTMSPDHYNLIKRSKLQSDWLNLSKLWYGKGRKSFTATVFTRDLDRVGISSFMILTPHVSDFIKHIGNYKSLIQDRSRYIKSIIKENVRYNYAFDLNETIYESAQILELSYPHDELDEREILLWKDRSILHYTVSMIILADFLLHYLVTSKETIADASDYNKYKQDYGSVALRLFNTLFTATSDLYNEFTKTFIGFIKTTDLNSLTPNLFLKFERGDIFDPTSKMKDMRQDVEGLSSQESQDE